MLKQHLIDPEICIRCYTCENTCPIEAITHDDNNVVVDAEKCNQCMDCIPVCPTGSIDEWRVVAEPYSLQQQFDWEELPDQQVLSDSADGSDSSIEALEETMAALLADAHSGAGGVSRAPASAGKPTINLYTGQKSATATVQGNYRLTAENADTDVRHIIIDLGSLPFPILEGQSVGVVAPGNRPDGKPHLPRLYSISSPRDGERPSYNNLSLTVKREEQGVCSNYVCDLAKGDQLQLTGPFGSTFLMPNDGHAKILMICTGTGSAPFRGFTMHRQRNHVASDQSMMLFFGARTPESLPYFGPLNKVPDEILTRYLVFSRDGDKPRRYVQDELLANETVIAEWLVDSNTHIYICGLRAMEEGINSTFEAIASNMGEDWHAMRQVMREAGRYHVETY